MYVALDHLLKVVLEYRAIGLKSSLKKGCKTVYVLDTYYRKFKKNFPDHLKIYFYDLNSINRATQLMDRYHKLSVIGTDNE